MKLVTLLKKNINIFETSHNSSARADAGCNISALIDLAVGMKRFDLISDNAYCEFKNIMQEKEYTIMPALYWHGYQGQISWVCEKFYGDRQAWVGHVGR